MKRKIILIVLILSSSLFFLYRYIYKGHRDIASEKEMFSLLVQDLKNEFQKSDSLANSKYLDKTIAIKGKITSIDSINNSIILDSTVAAIGKDLLKTNKVNDLVIIKGRFIGYDELFDEFKMDNCTLIQK
jgi:hypothetical protein